MWSFEPSIPLLSVVKTRPTEGSLPGATLSSVKRQGAVIESARARGAFYCEIFGRRGILN